MSSYIDIHNFTTPIPSNGPDAQKIEENGKKELKHTYLLERSVEFRLASIIMFPEWSCLFSSMLIFLWKLWLFSLSKTSLKTEKNNMNHNYVPS